VKRRKPSARTGAQSWDEWEQERQQGIVRVPRIPPAWWERTEQTAKPAPQKRHAPKSEPAIAVLKEEFPPDGRPSRLDVPDAELERRYHAACDRRGIHKNDRVKKSQLLRCTGRKK
jgi:hypothetical protein